MVVVVVVKVVRFVMVKPLHRVIEAVADTK